MSKDQEEESSEHLREITLEELDEIRLKDDDGEDLYDPMASDGDELGSNVYETLHKLYQL